MFLQPPCQITPASINDLPFLVINSFWARAESRSCVIKRKRGLRQQVNPRDVPMPLQG